MTNDPPLHETFDAADKYPIPRGRDGRAVAIAGIECHYMTSAWFKEAGPDHGGKEWKRVSDVTANHPKGTFAANGGLIIAKDHHNVPFVILGSEENAEALTRAGFERDQGMRVVGSAGERFQNQATAEALRRFDEIRRSRVIAAEPNVPSAGVSVFAK